MNIKDRIKSMSFWAGIIGAVILILGAFGVEIEGETANTVVNAVCSVLVLLGIVTVPKSDCEKLSESETKCNTIAAGHTETEQPDEIEKQPRVDGKCDSL